MNLLRGIMGTKKRIHLQVNGLLDKEIQEIAKMEISQPDKLSRLAETVDQKIWAGYKLWPSNYIAHDLLYGDNEYVDFYSEEEKSSFERRMNEKVNMKNEFLVKSFLAMYANPVNNQKAALTVNSPSSKS